VYGCPKIWATDAHKTPGLHKTNAGRMMCRIQQSEEQLRSDRIWQEMAHVTPLVNGSIDGCTFSVGVTIFAHVINKRRREKYFFPLVFA
jgi:hypothetical protein